MDVEAVKSWAEIHKLASNPLKFISALNFLFFALLYFRSVGSLCLRESHLSNHLACPYSAIKHAVCLKSKAGSQTAEYQDKLFHVNKEVKGIELM